MVTKKDFEAIAKVIKQNTVNPVNPAYHDHIFKASLVDDISYYFTKQNPNFIRERFIEACK